MSEIKHWTECDQSWFQASWDAPDNREASEVPTMVIGALTAAQNARRLEQTVGGRHGYRPVNRDWWAVEAMGDA